MTFLEDILIYFLKIKQESSGWPAYIQTKEEAFQYISNYAARENVKLNSEAITQKPCNEIHCQIAFKFILGKIWTTLKYATNLFFSRN